MQGAAGELRPSACTTVGPTSLVEGRRERGEQRERECHVFWCLLAKKPAKNGRPGREGRGPRDVAALKRAQQRGRGVKLLLARVDSVTMTVMASFAATELALLRGDNACATWDPRDLFLLSNQPLSPPPLTLRSVTPNQERLTQPASSILHAHGREAWLTHGYICRSQPCPPPALLTAAFRVRAGHRATHHPHATSMRPAGNPVLLPSLSL